MTKIANPLDFRLAAAAKTRPKAIAAAAGMLASAEVAAPPERVFADDQ
jgi:hypothetical protein